MGKGALLSSDNAAVGEQCGVAVASGVTIICGKPLALPLPHLSHVDFGSGGSCNSIVLRHVTQLYLKAQGLSGLQAV